MENGSHRLTVRARFAGLLLAAAIPALGNPATPGAGAAPPAPAAPSPAPAAGATRPVSAEVAAMLDAAMPQYAPAPPPASTAPSPPAVLVAAGTSPLAAPANAAPYGPTILLPRFVVREDRLPTPMEVMTPEELANYAMNKYLGSPDGLDRAFLNFVTLPMYWQAIPIVGNSPFVSAQTNEQRALEYYHEDRIRQEKADLNYMASFLKDNGRAADANDLKAETEDTYRPSGSTP